MPGAVRKSGTDSVDVAHGTGDNCASPETYATAAGSDNVKVNNIGVVRKGDAMQSHPNVGCSPHAPGLSTHSSNVFANGKEIGRKGDKYGTDHDISSGSSDVLINGPDS